MEVSGEASTDSKQNLKLFCIPCDNDGRKESAHGYCQDCKEHLCKTCFEDHRKPKPCRNHTLLDKDTMPLQPTAADIEVDVISDVCTKHREKVLEFYCNDHDTLACYVCDTLEHKKCKVDYIPDVSGNASVEWTDLNGKMEVLVEKCESNTKHASSTTEQLGQSYRKVIEEIRVFRKEINEYLDQMEAEMTKEVDAIVKTSKQKLDHVLDVCRKIVEDVKCSQSFLNALNEEKKHNKLYIEMKQVGPRVVALFNKEMQTVKEHVTVDEIAFVRNEKLFDQLKNIKRLGMISTYGKPSDSCKLCIQHERSLSFTFCTDKKKCNVSGMVMISATQMMVADSYNMKIKMIDVNTGVLESEIILSSSPYDITKLPENILAVVLGSQKCIQKISYTDKSLSLDHRINVKESCHSIAYCQNKLVVGCNYSPGKLLILDLAGNCIQVFDTQGLFRGPEKIVISNDEKFIFVSDYCLFQGKCLKLDWQGNAVQIFDDNARNSPKGMQELEDGTLLVCFRNSQTIERLSNNLTKCEIVGLEEAYLYHPVALAYSESDHKLYVSCSTEQHSNTNETIKVFNVKWMF